MTTQTERPASRWADADTAGATGGSAEFEDLATVRRFAEQVCALGDGSDFVQTIEACTGLQDMVRDFGGDMNKAATALVDAAVAVARDGEALREQAAQVAGLAADMSGDGAAQGASGGAGGGGSWQAFRVADPSAGHS